jgi:hypothetical protein
MTEKPKECPVGHPGWDAVRQAQSDDLDAVIRVARSALGHLVTMLETGASLGPEPCPLTAEDHVLLIGLIFEGVSVIVDLFDMKHSLSARRSPVTNALHALSPTSNPRVFPIIPMCNSPPLS